MIFLKNIETSVVVHVEDGSAEEAAFLAQRTADGRFPLYEQLRPSPELLTGASGAGVWCYRYIPAPLDAPVDPAPPAAVVWDAPYSSIADGFTFAGATVKPPEPGMYAGVLQLALDPNTTDGRQGVQIAYGWADDSWGVKLRLPADDYALLIVPLVPMAIREGLGVDFRVSGVVSGVAPSVTIAFMALSLAKVSELPAGYA